jgi:hypothetical protein
LAEEVIHSSFFTFAFALSRVSKNQIQERERSPPQIQGAGEATGGREDPIKKAYSMIKRLFDFLDYINIQRLLFDVSTFSISQKMGTTS